MSNPADDLFLSGGSREIDKYLTGKTANGEVRSGSASPIKESEIVNLNDDDNNDQDHEAKELALLRQANNKAKVVRARGIVNELLQKNEIDGRLLFTDTIERTFRYNYDNGNLKTSFVSAPGMYSRPIEVFRECFTSASHVDTLNDLMYEANVKKEDIKDEEVRLVLNADYVIMKKDADKEIKHLCTMSAGSAVWKAKKEYIPPDGFTVWTLQTVGLPGITTALDPSSHGNRDLKGGDARGYGAGSASVSSVGTKGNDIMSHNKFDPAAVKKNDPMWSQNPYLCDIVDDSDNDNDIDIVANEENEEEVEGVDQCDNKIVTKTENVVEKIERDTETEIDNFTHSTPLTDMPPQAPSSPLRAKQIVNASFGDQSLSGPQAQRSTTKGAPTNLHPYPPDPYLTALVDSNSIERNIAAHLLVATGHTAGADVLPSIPTHKAVFGPGLAEGDYPDSDSDEEKERQQARKKAAAAAMISNMDRLHADNMSNTDKLAFDNAATKLQARIRATKATHIVELKKEMSMAAAEIGTSMEVQKAAARLQSTYRARQGRRRVETMKKKGTKHEEKMGIEKQLTLVVHSCQDVSPYDPNLNQNIGKL